MKKCSMMKSYKTKTIHIFYSTIIFLSKIGYIAHQNVYFLKK